MNSDLEQLLEHNYNELINPEVCKKEILYYFKKTPEFDKEDIVFLKRLTKVASHVIKYDLEPCECFLAAIYDANLVSIKKIKDGLKLTPKERYQKEDLCGRNRRELLKMESHFHAHAGNIAKLIYDQTDDLRWLERRYKHYKLSGDISISIDTKHASHAYGFAADTAKQLYEETRFVYWANLYEKLTDIYKDLMKDFDEKQYAKSIRQMAEAHQMQFEETKDIELAKKAYSEFVESAKILRKHESGMTAPTFGAAAKLARELYEHYKENIDDIDDEEARESSLKWLKRFYNNIKISAVLIDDENFTELAMHINSFVGDAARFLYEETGELCWARIQYNSFKYSANIAKNINLKKESYFLGFASDGAKYLFMETDELHWAEKWYEDTKKSAELAVNFNKKHAAHNFGWCGDAARAIYKKTKEKKWAQLWYKYHKVSADMALEIGSSYAPNGYSFSGDAAYKMHSLTKSPKWANRAYNNFLKAAELFEEADDKGRMAQNYYMAGRIAYYNYVSNQKSDWALKAKENYMKFLENEGLIANRSDSSKVAKAARVVKQVEALELESE